MQFIHAILVSSDEKKQMPETYKDGQKLATIVAVSAHGMWYKEKNGPLSECHDKRGAIRIPISVTSK